MRSAGRCSPSAGFPIEPLLYTSPAESISASWTIGFYDTS